MKTLLRIFVLLLYCAGFTACNQNNCDGGNPDGCACYEIYAPVCGCDNVTYSNDCHAECAGITDYTEGTCD